MSAASAASAAVLSAARAVFSAASAASAAFLSAARAAATAAISSAASTTSIKAEIDLTDLARSLTSTAGIATEMALLLGVAGYVSMNSETPAAFEAVGTVEVKLINARVGITPGTPFPKTSVIFALCFTMVDVYGFTCAVYAIV